MSLVSVSRRTMPGLCSDSAILAGVALAAAWASWSLRRALATGTSSFASIWLVMTTAGWPGAGLRRAVSFASRAASAAVRSFFAVLTAAAAFFLAGLGTLRSGSSGVTA